MTTGAAAAASRSIVVSINVLTLLRRVISIGLVVAVVLVHAASFDLHVHGGDAGLQHAPAVHHHDAVDHAPSPDAEMAGVDDRGTVIPVRLSVASPTVVKPALVACQDSTSIDPAAATIVNRTRIVARAHGPPTIPRYALRAPPSSSSL